MLIDVTIDIRDLDADGAAPAHATVRFARLNPTSVDGTLITAASVPVPLMDGHGTVQLEAGTAYRVTASGIVGVRTSFAILTGNSPTSLADLWQTGQINPADYTAQPIPDPLDVTLAALRADITALQTSGGGTGGPAGREYPQTSPAATWGPILHSLGRRPTVTVYDANGDEIAPDVHATTTTVSLVFATPTAGTAVLI